MQVVQGVEIFRTKALTPWLPNTSAYSSQLSPSLEITLVSREQPYPELHPQRQSRSSDLPMQLNKDSDPLLQCETPLKCHLCVTAFPGIS